MIFPARNLNNMSVAKEFLGPWSGCSWRRRWLGRCGHLDVSGFDWMVNVLVAGSWFPIYAIFPGKPGVVFHHGVSWWTIWINGFMWVPRSCPKVMAGEEAPWKELCCACFLSRQEVHRPVAQVIGDGRTLPAQDSALEFGVTFGAVKLGSGNSNGLFNFK